ncbi:hypothetical protein DMH15_18260 [Streptomyces sp. WAC 06725]|uniref:Uma2 family endonuclease n=1 Tax=Streptomyces sp. WAC 06725 TaxID=2203209 RepID=UPI000F74426D|nr:Uma2 family endonuclease [Streptomyces sp. WAC 06725]RSO37507.1 hypothetical protein DMH15_18260 [Streptomyces sp. WAC 06725]
MTTGIPHHPPARRAPDSYTTHDLLAPPDIPAHVELIDGCLLSQGRQTAFHSLVIDLLRVGLCRTVPPGLTARCRMTVVIDKRNAPEPDLVIVQAAAARSRDQPSFHARDVLLAVEVVLPQSQALDRDTKPRKYADAGIPHFWRVENDGPGRYPVVHVFGLDPATRTYHPVGTFREQLELDAPFGISIDLTEIDRL